MISDAIKPAFTIERLKRMAVFARVVEQRLDEHGLAQARHDDVGREPAVAPARSGDRPALLHRSTWRLSTTEAGQAYYEDCATMLQAVQAVEQRLSDLRDEPRGELRIALLVNFCEHLAAAMVPLLQAHLRAHGAARCAAGEGAAGDPRAVAWVSTSALRARLAGRAVRFEGLVRTGEEHEIAHGASPASGVVR